MAISKITSDDVIAVTEDIIGSVTLDHESRERIEKEVRDPEPRIVDVMLEVIMGYRGYTEESQWYDEEVDITTDEIIDSLSEVQQTKGRR